MRSSTSGCERQCVRALKEGTDVCQRVARGHAERAGGYDIQVMNKRIKPERVRILAADASVSDSEVVDAFDHVLHSYNAESAGQTLLGVACSVAHFRPHLLSRVLRHPVNAQVCMGVENLEQFWEYSRFYVKRDAGAEAKYRDFDEVGLSYFEQRLPLQSDLIAQLIREEFLANTGLDKWLLRFGLSPSQNQLSEIRETLRNEIAEESRSQGCGDTDLMKLCCVQLFNSGTLDDALLVWRAKTSSMDTDGSIDVQLLCGKGQEETKNHLIGLGTEEARMAFDRVRACEGSGDFEGFSPADWSASYVSYYEQSDGE